MMSKNSNNFDSFAYAGFLRRISAVIIDYAFVAVLALFFYNIIAKAFFGFIETNPESDLAIEFNRFYVSHFSDYVMFTIVFALIPLILNFCIFVWLFGGSVGQKVMRLKVIETNMERCGFLRCTARMLIMLPVVITTPLAAKIITGSIMNGQTVEAIAADTWALSVGPYLVMLVSWLISIFTVIYSTRKQSLHDMATGTVVVKTI